MSYLDARGHKVPSGTDLASRQSLLDLSLSIGDIKTVSSQSAAQTYVNALKSAGATINSDNCVYVDVNGVLRRWDGAGWADVITMPFVREAVWTQFPGWKWQAGSHKWVRIGPLVFFTGGEIGTSSARYYRDAAGALEMGTPIPAGFRPSGEYKAHIVFMNGWGDLKEGFWVFRANGTSMIISEESGVLPTVDTWHSVVIPAMCWYTADPWPA